MPFQIPIQEIEFHFIRAQGAGGQNVNKVSSAVHLRFDIKSSSLPEFAKQNLLNSRDTRINSDGIVVIKAQNYRKQDQNRMDALARLQGMVDLAMQRKTKRKATRPSYSARQRRMDGKTRHGRKKEGRRKVEW